MFSGSISSGKISQTFMLNDSRAAEIMFMIKIIVLVFGMQTKMHIVVCLCTTQWYDRLSEQIYSIIIIKSIFCIDCKLEVLVRAFFFCLGACGHCFGLSSFSFKSCFISIHEFQTNMNTRLLHHHGRQTQLRHGIEYHLASNNTLIL